MIIEMIKSTILLLTILSPLNHYHHYHYQCNGVSAEETTNNSTNSTTSRKKPNKFCKSKFLKKSRIEFQKNIQRKPDPSYKFTENDFPLTGSGVANETLVMLFGSSMLVKIPVSSIKADQIDILDSSMSIINLSKQFPHLRSTNYSSVFHYNHFNAGSLQLTRLGVHCGQSKPSQSYRSFVVLNSFNHSIQQFQSDDITDFDYVFNSSGSGYLVIQGGSSTNVNGLILFTPFEYQFPIELVKYPKSIPYYYWIQISDTLSNSANINGGQQQQQSFLNQSVTFVRINSSDLGNWTEEKNPINNVQFNGNVTGFIQNSVVYLFDLTNVYYFNYVELGNGDPPRTQFQLNKVQWKVFFSCFENKFNTILPLELWVALLISFSIFFTIICHKRCKSQFISKHFQKVKSTFRINRISSIETSVFDSINDIHHHQANNVTSSNKDNSSQSYKNDNTNKTN